MSDIHDSALSFIRGSGWIQPVEVAREITNLQAHGADWPKATREEWLKAIDELVADGKLQAKAGLVFLAVEETKPTEQQMELF